MSDSADSGDEITTLDKGIPVSHDEKQTEATASNLSLSEEAQLTSPAQSTVSVNIPAINLNEGSFNRPHFGPKTETQLVEANQIEYASITHHHTHYHEEGHGSDGEGITALSAHEKKQARRKRRKSGVPEGYARISDDMFMDKRKPLKVGTQVFHGYISHISGQKQKIVIKKIVPCDEKSIREVQHLVNLSPHRNVVQILRSVKHESITHFELYIAMELCKPQNLQDYLDENRESNKSFDFTQTMSYARQLINGVTHIHTHRIIHKDLKPENILFSLDGTQIKVSDFGISKQLQGSRTRTNLTSQGTDGFRAPETFLSDSISMKCDIYSLAVTLFSMFANGKHPYGQDQLLQIYKMVNNIGRDLSGLPDEMGSTMKELLKDLLVKMLDLDPTKRPSIEEVACDSFFTISPPEVTTHHQPPSAANDDEMNESTGIEGLGIVVTGDTTTPETSVLPRTAVISKEDTEEVGNWSSKLLFMLPAGIVIAIAIFLQIRSTSGPGGILYLRSKSMDGVYGNPEPHLQADFCAAGEAPPPISPVRINKHMNIRNKLQQLIGPELTTWTVAVYFTNPDFERRFEITELYRGMRICHKCSRLEELKPANFSISMTYVDDIRSLELADAVPNSQKCLDLEPEDSWFGILFWFDEETLEMYACIMYVLIWAI